MTRDGVAMRIRQFGHLLRAAWLAIRTVLTWVAVAPIRGYQLFISPYTPASCRYHPTCSAYGVKEMRRHGPVKGTLLTTYRLARCNPWTAGGLDPVPQRGAWRPDITTDGRTAIPLIDLRCVMSTHDVAQPLNQEPHVHH